MCGALWVRGFVSGVPVLNMTKLAKNLLAAIKGSNYFVNDEKTEF